MLLAQCSYAEGQDYDTVILMCDGSVYWGPMWEGLMNNLSLASVKDCAYIFSDKGYILACGKRTHLFRTDGTHIATYKFIRNPWKVVFLPNDTVLIDALNNGAYHYLSLSTGEVLWSSTQKGRRLFYSNRFAVSPDRRTVYDVCQLENGMIHVDVLQPQIQSHTYFQISGGLRVTRDAFCDSLGHLCLLQTQVDANMLQQYAVLEILEGQEGIQYSWKYRWSRSGEIANTVCGGDSLHVLYLDLTVENLETKETFGLLENDDQPPLPKDRFTWSFDKERCYLTLSYIGERLNVIIDCKARKRIAQYIRETDSVGFTGCLIGNEFWVGTENGIVKKPFPYFEV